MKYLLQILISLLSSITFGQSHTIISGKVVDEKGRPVDSVMVHFSGDTGYTDKKGCFRVAYPGSEKYKYFFYLEKEGFLPKRFSLPLDTVPVLINTPVIIRSRKAYWYDSKQIDSTHLGITISEAIRKYKIDTSQCYVVDEPPGMHRGFRTELADSAYLFFLIKGFYSQTRLKMIHLLGSTIIGIGVADTKGNEKYFGRGFLWNGGVYNPYYVESLWKKEAEEKKKQ
jgi:hypothetical protein